MSELEKQLLKEQLGWYKLQRHDWLNHWQVIQGYLQLNKVDRVVEYMHDALKGFEAEQKCGEIAQALVSATLLSMVIKLNIEGIVTYISLAEEFKSESFWQNNWREEYGQLLYGYTTECISDTLETIRGNSNGYWAELELTALNTGFQCQFNLCTESISLLEKELRF